MPDLAERDRDALADIMRAASLAQAFLGDQDLDAFTADLKTQAAVLP